MKTTIAIAIAGVIAAAAAGPVRADPAQMRLVVPLPAASPTTKVMHAWTDETNAASGGALHIQFIGDPTVANLFNAYDRINNGVVDAAFGNFGPLATQFRRTAVVTLPFETKNGVEATMGFWRTFAKGAFGNEYDKVKPLALWTYPNVSLHGHTAIKTQADLKGLKVAAQGRIITRALQNLGATPVAMTVMDFYQALARNTVDTVAFSWPAMFSFKFNEQTQWHLDVSLGNDNVYVFMSKNAYNRLPANARAVIDKASGEVLTERMMKVVNAQVDGTRKRIAGMPGHTVATLDPAEEARWVKAVAPVVDEWTKETPDGPKVLAAFREEVKKIRASGM